MPGAEILHTYVFVRTDMPVASQAVQVGHACLEAGAQFGRSAADAHLVLLGVPSEAALRDALARLDVEGISYALFFEPDEGLGFTAACTEPLAGEGRRFFRRYRLR
jgi:hypothetical protein